jgi:ABC-type uncharacterized transport system permease subunit
MQNSFIWLSALAYAIAAFGLWQYVLRQRTSKPQLRAMVISTTVVAAALHGASLYSSSVSLLGINPSLVASFSTVAFWAVIFFVLVSLFRSTLTLGLPVLPLAILAVLTSHWLSPDQSTALTLNSSLNKHLMFAVVTFAVLSLAAAQAIIILIQERNIKQLHAHTSSSMPFGSLPPLQSMDSQLFQLLLIGFLLLCISFIFGVASNLNLHNQPFILSHHIILTLLASIGFAALLICRAAWGWRGRKAAKMTLITYGLFVLGYFGTRFVREIILS